MRAKREILRKQSYFGKNSRLRVVRIANQAAMGQHRHEFYEIAVVLSGSAVHETGDYRHRLESGDVLVLHPRRTHGYEDCRSLNLVNLLVREDVLARIARSLGGLPGYHALFHLESSGWFRHEYGSHLHLSPEELKRVEDWVARIEEESAMGSRAVRLLEEACLALIVDLLCRQYEVRFSSVRNTPAVESVRLARLLSWIAKNLDRPLPREELARQAGMSLRTFHRVFQRSLQMSPHEYVMRERIRRAREMLDDAGHPLPVTEIALACGFEDSNYFSRSFREATGQTPSAYRNGKKAF